MNKRIILLLIVFASLVVAGMPSTGDITLRLRDAQQRPIANATVTFEYTFTDPYLGELHKTDVHYSSSYGVMEKRITADFNTPYKITVSHNYATQVIESTWTGGFDRFINLPLMDFSVRVVDTEGNPIPNVPLRVKPLVGREFNSSVNATGYRIFTQYNRDVPYSVYGRYGSTETAIDLVPDGLLHTMQIPTYSFEVRPYSESGNAIVADMKITYLGVGPSERSSTGVSALFTQLPEGNISVSITYRNKTLSDAFYLNSSITKPYIIDLTPPTISQPKLSPEKPVPENEVIVTAEIYDAGRNASGMPAPINMIPPAELYYSLDAVEWKSAHMFPQSDNRTYKGKIPGQPRDSVIRYYVVAWDSANNSARSEQYSFNTFIDGGSNGDGNGSGDPFAAILPYWWVPIPIIIIAAGAFVLKKRYL